MRNSNWPPPHVVASFTLLAIAGLLIWVADPGTVVPVLTVVLGKLALDTRGTFDRGPPDNPRLQDRR